MLAERIGVSRVMVRAWLTGAVSPPMAYFFRIIDILHEAEPGSLALPDERKDEQPRKSTS
jgi:transcriptional regulator with XRE-family HTH domain